MSQIFIVGEQRSGSNLLRLILNESPEIAAPHPPHILQRFMPLIPLYGDLSRENTFMQLIDDVCRLVETNPVPWEGVKLDRQSIYDSCSKHTLVAVFDAIMSEYARVHKASSWVCKSMQNIRWADEIDDHFSSPRFIYLYRDPRDVTLSFLRAPVGEKHPYFIAQKWKELQEICLHYRNKLPKTRFFSIKYEDLTSDPDSIVKSLCAFLNIEFNDSMLNFHKSTEATRSAKSSQLWENLTKPIMKSNSQKFLTGLSEKDIGIVESVAGEVMDKLGYERHSVMPDNEMHFTDQQIKEYDKKNSRAKQEFQSKLDKEDLRRRQIQEQVLEDVKSRHSDMDEYRLNSA